jgi:hypothetical protein
MAKSGLKYYKIKFRGAEGTGLYFVVKTIDAATALKMFHALGYPTWKRESEPMKSSKKFVGNVRMREDAYWCIKP